MVHQWPRREIDNRPSGLAVVKATLQQPLAVIDNVQIRLLHACLADWDAHVDTVRDRGCQRRIWILDDEKPLLDPGRDVVRGSPRQGGELAGAVGRELLVQLGGGGTALGRGHVDCGLGKPGEGRRAVEGFLVAAFGVFEEPGEGYLDEGSHLVWCFSDFFIDGMDDVGLGVSWN